MPFIGKQPKVGAYQLIDSITTSATATYALTVDGSAYFPETARNLIVSLNGVTQAPESAYTVSGSNIVFDSALTTSDVIDYILVIGDAVDIGVPSDGTVGNAQLASNIDLSGKTLTLSDNQISGDAIDGGTISNFASTGIDDNATSTAITIKSGGNVGIGSDDPRSKLTVAGTAPKITLESTDTQISDGEVLGSLAFYSNDASGSAAGEWARIDAVAEGEWDAATTKNGETNLAFYTTDNTGSPATAERMRISYNGNVGIGTNDPDTKLDVRGIVLGGAGSPSTGQIAFGVQYGGSTNIANTYGTMKSTAATCIGWGVYGSPSVNEGFVSSVDTSLNFRRGALLVDQDELRFLNAGQQTVARDAAVTMTERFKVDASGRLLTGTTSPIQSSQLTVRNSSINRAATFSMGSTTSGNVLVSFESDLNTAGIKCIVRGDGDLENINNSYGAFSDKRLKSNIVDASSQISDIMAVKVRSYTLNLTGETHIGVVAQELEEAGMSGLVKEGDEGFKSVKYSVLYIKAIKAIQEQQAIIEDLQTRLSALEAN